MTLKIAILKVTSKSSVPYTVLDPIIVTAPAAMPVVHVNDEQRGARLLPEAADGEKTPAPPYRSAIFVTVSMFMGYAALVVLQHRLKVEHDKVPHPEDSLEFKHASTLNYVGNLIFRLAHNFVFCFLSPRQRVHLSLFAMAAAMAVLAFAICIAKSPWIGWVFIAYFLGGVGVGTFESNLLNSVTHLGHATKKWAIFGMPLGFNLISVGGFLAMLAGAPLVALYLAVFTSCILSMTIFYFMVPAPVLPATTTAPATGFVPPATNAGEPESILEADVRRRVAELSAESEARMGAVGVIAPAGGSHFARFKRDIIDWRGWVPTIAPHMSEPTYRQAHPCSPCCRASLPYMGRQSRTPRAAECRYTGCPYHGRLCIVTDGRPTVARSRPDVQYVLRQPILGDHALHPERFQGRGGSPRP